MQFIVIGRGGTDGPTVVIGPDGKPHVQPGWGIEALAEVSAALGVLRAASRLKSPGLAEAAIKSVLPTLQKELGGHLKEGGVIIYG
jgi:hypothetical protein